MGNIHTGKSMSEAVTDLAQEVNDLKGQRDELLEAATNLADRADNARSIMQDGFRRKGWSEDEIAQYANWGMLDTSELRTAIARAKEERS